MSAQQLPGPLLARNWFNHSATTVGYVEDSGRFVALSDCSTGPDFAVTYEPLARLFSAAPELLAALEEARNGLDWYRQSFPGATDGSDDEAMARIDAAIAKATGGQS